jgi:hypothetical protein
VPDGGVKRLVNNCVVAPNGKPSARLTRHHRLQPKPRHDLRYTRVHLS